MDHHLRKLKGTPIHWMKHTQTMAAIQWTERSWFTMWNEDLIITSIGKSNKWLNKGTSRENDLFI